MEESMLTLTINKQIPMVLLPKLKDQAQKLGYQSLEECLSVELDKVIIALQMPEDWQPGDAYKEFKRQFTQQQEEPGILNLDEEVIDLREDE